MSGPELPVPLDLLWAIHDSGRLYGAQNELAGLFEEFIGALGGPEQVAVRTAVTSSEVVGFRFKPEKAAPPAYWEVRHRACLGNADCASQLGGEGWECMAYPKDQMFNLNGSCNSFCIFRCQDDSECCGQFCFEDDCAGDRMCIKEQCLGAPGDACTYECMDPMGGGASSGCLLPPVSADCPEEVSPILEGKSLSLFRCLALGRGEYSGGELSFGAVVDQDLRMMWYALDPIGPNAAEASAFLRPEAELAVVALANAEDCSIDPDYASPNFTCNENKDCPGWDLGLSACKTDAHLSNMKGQEVKLCHGAIEKGYFDACGLLGEYAGAEHHKCAYDADCDDCQTDTDCQEWWYCKKPKTDPPATSGKCRPSIFSLPPSASYQNPPGSPVFSLAPVAPFRDRLLSLKKDPLQVFVGAIAGDGLALPPAEDGGELPSFISQACLDDPKLGACQAFAKTKKTAPPKCVSEPGADGCDDYWAAKLACIRECYIASTGNPKSPTTAKNTYISYTDEYGGNELALRIMRFARLFGPAGAVYNLNAPGGIRAALLDIADRLNKRIYRACLPEGYTPDVTVLLLRHLPGEDARAADRASPGSLEDVSGAGTDSEPQWTASGPGELLTQGPDGDYEILPAWYACCPEGHADCDAPGPAIQFHAMVKAGTTFEVVYVGQ